MLDKKYGRNSGCEAAFGCQSDKAEWALASRSISCLCRPTWNRKKTATGRISPRGFPKTVSFGVGDLQPSSGTARGQWQKMEPPHFALHSLLGLTPIFQSSFSRGCGSPSGYSCGAAIEKAELERTEHTTYKSVRFRLSALATSS
jgi:hypothetical protein